MKIAFGIITILVAGWVGGYGVISGYEAQQAVTNQTEQIPAKPILKWQELESNTSATSEKTFRAKIPGGWLVAISVTRISGNARGNGNAVTFVPDPNHEWTGGSIE